MPYLTPEEVKSYFLRNAIEPIDDADERKDLSDAITAAISEAYSYLDRYDRGYIFDATTTDRNPVLLMYIKDIAVWNFLATQPAPREMEYREKRYNAAKKFLLDVQAGKATPDLPQLLPDDEFPQGNSMLRWGSQWRRQTGY